MARAPAPAKINLALVVGPLGDDGTHEVVTVLERLELADRVSVERASSLRVDGFRDDSVVRGALTALAARAGVAPGFAATIAKRIPVAAGLGGGSSDAAAALRLANELLPEPLGGDALHEVAASLGADVPFFLRPGPQLGTGDGSTLASLDLPRDYAVVVVLPHGETKLSTAAVYRRFDERGGAAGFEERRAALLTALARVRRPRDLASLPPNDLASSPLAGELRSLGAFRADVSGAGPALYGLFDDAGGAARAAATLGRRGRVWATVPAGTVEPWPSSS